MDASKTASNAALLSLVGGGIVSIVVVVVAARVTWSFTSTGMHVLRKMLRFCCPCFFSASVPEHAPTPAPEHAPPPPTDDVERICNEIASLRALVERGLRYVENRDVSRRRQSRHRHKHFSAHRSRHLYRCRRQTGGGGGGGVGSAVVNPLSVSDREEEGDARVSV